MATRLEGTITLNFEDTDSVARDLYAVRTATLVINTQGPTGENPTDKDWENSEPELSDWTADLTFNVDKTEDTQIPHVSQSEIEALCIAKTIFPVTFAAESGAEYDGSAFVATYRLSSADQTAFTGMVVLRGTTKLTPSNPTT